MTPGTKTLIGALSLMLLARAGDIAATTTSGIRGVVRDVSDEPVPGAAVVLTHQEFGTKLTLETDKKGKFLQVGIKAGAWELLVEKRGFAENRQSVKLALGKTTAVDVVLQADVPAAGAAAVESFSLGGAALSKEAATAYETAQRALAAGDTKAARTALESVVALAPEVAVPHFALAQLQRDAREPALAEATLRRGLELDPSLADGWLALGELQSEADRLDDALASFQKAVLAKPDHARAHSKLAMAFVMKQDFAGAIPELERYLALDPDAADAASKRSLLEECRKFAK